VANDRMLLVHIPSKRAVTLAKRLASPWYTPGPMSEKMDDFFELIGEDWDSRNFTLLFEEDGKPWKYKNHENGIWELEYEDL
jgi:hypothetical protein